MNAERAVPGCLGAKDDGPLVKRLRTSLPRPLVFVAGVFDLLHAGHVGCLEWARSHGTSLVVGVSSDLSARRQRKGPGRPFKPAAERARVVAALAAVSGVVVYDEEKPLALMCALRPDVFVRGGDCDAGRLAESALMAEWGGRTEIFPYVDGQSTNALLLRIERARPLLHRPGPTAQPGAPLLQAAAH